MSEHLERLARRVADDAFFLAPALALYARSEGLDEAALAARLECPLATLTLLRLCRMPHAQPPRFGQDIDCIATRFTVRAEVLAEVVRRGQNLLQLRATETTAPDAAGFLLAARDRSDEPPPTPLTEEAP